MAGTSMATPLVTSCSSFLFFTLVLLLQVAGVAAQIRQYFQTFNPSVITGCDLFTGSGSLSQVTCDHLSNPKGATVKAMLIQSGEQMSLYDSESASTTQASVTLLGTPDMYQVKSPTYLSVLELSQLTQGFGRVSLPNVLPYPGIETILQLQVIETTIYPYQEIIHIVEVHDVSRPFKATLAWMDPNNAIMTNRMLLNNLDLKVITPSGQVLYGNNAAGDEVNNVRANQAYWTLLSLLFSSFAVG
jgi:hypothetical protein